MLELINEYLDAAPRSAAEPEQVGRFTLFRPTGPWKYYARPRLGLLESITQSDVDRLRSRQRELKLPENIEWVVDITPSLERAAVASGLAVEKFPLMVLGAGAHEARQHPPGIEIRLLSPDEPDFARGHAVAHVGFGAPGTGIGREGARERDDTAATMSVAMVDFQKARARTGLSISYAAFDDDGPLCVGTHQPVGRVTEIVGVATLPSARRRGLGVAVTAALVADARTRGVETVFLSAGSEDVARIYERVGFRRIGLVGSAGPPVSPES
jgi:ribosomal protein S18 acetylase RimI-like enzyme